MVWTNSPCIKILGSKSENLDSKMLFLDLLELMQADVKELYVFAFVVFGSLIFFSTKKASTRSAEA
jgi:hypothetical protein